MKRWAVRYALALVLASGGVALAEKDGAAPPPAAAPQVTETPAQSGKETPADNAPEAAAAEAPPQAQGEQVEQVEPAAPEQAACEPARREEVERLAREAETREQAARAQGERTGRERAEATAREEVERLTREAETREQAARERGERSARELAEATARERAARAEAERLQATQANSAPDTDPIDQAYRQCRTAAGTAAGAVQTCVRTANAAWERAMNDAYAALMRRIDRPSRAQLEDSQRLWRAFLVSEAHFQSAPWRPARLAPAIAEENLRLLRQRTQMLRTYAGQGR